MNRDTFLKPALIAGILVGIASALPVVNTLNCFCCAWVIGGGILAAYLHVHASPIAVTLGRGVALGLVTGVIAAVIDTIFSIPLHFALTGIGMGMVEQAMDMLDQVPNLPPGARDAFRSVLTEGGSLFFVTLTGLFKVIVYGVVCMLGGAVGVAIFEKRPPGADSRISAPVYQPPRDVPPPPDFPIT